jgi:transposase-like protein
MSLKKTSPLSSEHSAKKPSVKPSVKPLQLRQSRTFSTLFKQQLVSDLDYKRTTIREVCQQYQVSSKTVYQWLHQYSPHHQGRTRMVVECESEEKQTAALRARVAELERIVGQKQIQLDYLEQIISVANVHYGDDLKKNSATKWSSISAEKKPNEGTR